MPGKTFARTDDQFEDTEHLRVSRSDTRRRGEAVVIVVPYGCQTSIILRITDVDSSKCKRLHDTGMVPGNEERKFYFTIAATDDIRH